MAELKYQCSWNGCRALLSAKGYCKRHAPLVKKRQEARVAQRLNAFRTAMQTNKKLYNSADWKKMRTIVLSRHPYCVCCGSKSDLHVDHVVPPRGDKVLFFNINNLQVLCAICHRQKTATEALGRRGEVANEQEARAFAAFYAKKNEPHTPY